MSGDQWDDDGPEYSSPLPLGERSWRHPSELGPGAAAFAPPPVRAPRIAAIAVSVLVLGLIVGLARLLAPSSGSSVSRVASGDASNESVEPGDDAAPVPSTKRDDNGATTSSAPPSPSISRLGAQSLSTLMVAGSGRAAVPVGDGRHALTTAGSLRPGEFIEVLTSDGTLVTAEVVTVITERDIAVLALSRRIRGEVRTIATEPPSDGDHVVVGLSGVDAYIRMTASGPVIEGDLPLLEGEPVIDDRGQLLGLVASGPDGSARVVMIPAIAALRSSVLVIDVWLGLRFETDSLRVLEAQPGSPAAATGVLIGDVLRAIDGRELRSIDDLWTVLARLDAGDAVNLVVMRDGIEQELVVELVSRPS